MHLLKRMSEKLEGQFQQPDNYELPKPYEDDEEIEELDDDDSENMQSKLASAQLNNQACFTYMQMASQTVEERRE